MTQFLCDITWDDKKALNNAKKHGVSFAEAASVITDPLALTVFDNTHSETEQRWFTIGQTTEGKLLAVSHTHQATDNHMSKVRLISAREVTKKERQCYENSNK